MKTGSIVLMGLAIVAAVLGFWVLAGIVAFVIRVLALVLLVLAVLAFRRKITSEHRVP